MRWQPAPTPIRKVASIALFVTASLLLSLAKGFAAEESIRSLGRSRSLAATVGIYHWGGRHSSGFAAGIRDVIGLNASIARVTISPRMNIDYNRGTACIPGFTLSGAL